MHNRPLIEALTNSRVDISSEILAWNMSAEIATPIGKLHKSGTWYSHFDTHRDKLSDVTVPVALYPVYFWIAQLDLVVRIHHTDELRETRDERHNIDIIIWTDIYIINRPAMFACLFVCLFVLVSKRYEKRYLVCLSPRSLKRYRLSTLFLRVWYTNFRC